jgi:DNA (cytosine-5)-methyltransferase 1
MNDSRTLTAPENDRSELQPPATDRAARPIALGFFSGAMGLDLGLEAAGFAVRLACEKDDDAAATIRKNRPELPLISDIHEHTAAQVRAAAGIGDADIDLAAGSPPCQTFSTAGKGSALNDTRGIAILKFVSLSVELKPKYIVLENVRGLLSAEGGDVLEKILSMLRDSGYEPSFNLYDTAYFGVPRHRDRVILIGNRDGCRVPYLRPTHSDRPEDGLPPWRTLRNAIGDMSVIEHQYVQFPDERLAFFEKLKAGQNWRNLSVEDQKAALSQAVLEAEGGKPRCRRSTATC